ncbi:MAG: cysteine hydrolase [Mycobacterium sp.]
MPDRPNLVPRNTALLVMDYQNGIVAELPHTDSLLDRASTAVESAREHGAYVGWVRIAFTDNDFDAIPETSTFAAMTAGEPRSRQHVDAPATQIHARLNPLPGDITVRKTRVGAFYTTDLDQQLRKRAVATLIVAGLSTSGVVLSTVREAMDRDYQIVVLHDACADRDQDTHDFLTTKLFPGHIHVTNVDALEALWVQPRTSAP